MRSGEEQLAAHEAAEPTAPTQYDPGTTVLDALVWLRAHVEVPFPPVGDDPLSAEVCNEVAALDVFLLTPTPNCKDYNPLLR